jgi:hypothetical protein
VRSARLRAAAVVAACAVALAGCGSGHPGAAALVGGVTISDDSLEHNTHGFCELIETVNQAQQGTSPPVPLRAALLNALNTLVLGEALDQAAARNNVEVTEAEVRQWVGALPFDFSRIPDQRMDEVQSVLERVGRNTLLVEELGRVAYQRQNPGGPGPSAQQVQQLGQQLVNGYMRRVGVETNPRYGKVDDTQQLPGTGSLSIAVSQEGIDAQGVPEPDSSLSPSQTCA